jgi:hypothetical protein
MAFWKLPERLIASGGSAVQLPIRRTELLHVFSAKKILSYELAPLYKWIKISPKVLYRLQSGKEWYAVPLGEGRSLKITDWKFISTVFSAAYTWSEHPIITSCIENPISLDNPDNKPQFSKHISYKWKEYVILAWQHDAFQGYAKKDFILVEVNETLWLSAKKLFCIEFSDSARHSLSEEDWVPVLTVSYSNPDAPGGIYENGEYKHEKKFNLWKRTVSDKSRYMDYRSHWEHDVCVTEEIVE